MAGFDDDIPRLREAFSYDRNTGEFFWRINRANKKIGDLAGNVGPNGYCTIMLDYKFYYAHHLAIAFETGHFPPPKSHTDHRNWTESDNRPPNLRVTTPSKNLLNRRGLNKNNTSGYAGVFLNSSGMYKAYITVNRRRIHLGHFSSLASAVAARQTAHAYFS